MAKQGHISKAEDKGRGTPCLVTGVGGGRLHWRCPDAASHSWWWSTASKSATPARGDKGGGQGQHLVAAAAAAGGGRGGQQKWWWRGREGMCHVSENKYKCIFPHAIHISAM